MANEYAVFTNNWTTVLQDGENVNIPQLAVDFPYDGNDGVKKWQDVTGNHIGVSPNQYQIEVWANTATMDLIQLNNLYTMVPGSWVDLDVIPEEVPE